MQLIDLPTELLWLLLRQATPQDASALMRTCHRLYDKLAPELYQDLPVLRVSDVTYENTKVQEKARCKAHLQIAAREHTGAELAMIAEHYERIMHLVLVKAAPMSVGHLQQHGAKAKNVVLHVERLGFLPQPEKNLNDALLEISKLFSSSPQLDVFGFTTSSLLWQQGYDAFRKILQTDIRPRILLLPCGVGRKPARGPHGSNSTIFDAQFHVRRGNAIVEEDSDTVYRRMRERPNIASEHRKFLDVYAPEGTDLDIVKAAINQPTNVVEEVTIFGTDCISDYEVPAEFLKPGPYQAFTCEMNHVTDKLRCISIVNSFTNTDIVHCSHGKYRNRMQPFSTAVLLERIEAAHANNSSPKPNRFIYRQYTTRGGSEDQHDPLPGSSLLKFISISDVWKVLCFHRDIPFNASITSFAFKTLVYASFRFGEREATMGELTAFGEQAPNLQWLGVNYNPFTQMVERGDDKYEQEAMQDLAHALRSMKKLRVLCLFANAPSGGHTSQSNHTLDKAVGAIADVAVQQGLPITFIHLVFRNIDSTQLCAAISYRIGRTEKIVQMESEPDPTSEHPEPVIPCFTEEATVSRVDVLPFQVHEDLEAMGGGNRFNMRRTLADTLGHLYVTQHTMMKRLLGRIARVDKAEQRRKANELEVSSGTKRSLSPQGYEGEPEAKAPRLADDAAV